MLPFSKSSIETEDRTKLETIYMKYYKEMYYTAMSVLNNTDDAQDAVQSSILKIATHIKKIEEVNCSKIKHLIITIVRNTAIDIYRYKQMHPYIQLEYVDGYSTDVEQYLDGIIIRLEDVELFAEKLIELKNEYAEIVILRYYYELDETEIANILSISYGNVRTRLSRAKIALRKLLEGDCYNI